LAQATCKQLVETQKHLSS